MRRAVFLDRDGTVSEEVGYVNHIDRFKVFPWTAEAVRRLNEAGLLTILVTNQSGVARGYFPIELVEEVHDRLKTEMAGGGAHLDGVYFCPHHPDGVVDPYRVSCKCRKPEAGLIRQAARDFGVNLEASFMVGDRYLDVETGFRAGTRGVLLLTGYGKGERLYQRESWPRQPDFVARNLLDAAEWIIDSRNFAAGAV